LPLLARIQQKGQDMKEADIFESWMDNIVEGTWALPETPEQLDRLQELMSQELIVGPDATNATAQLDDLIGDDILFDRLSDLAARDATANIWDDSDVQARLAELGVQTPQSTNSDSQQADPDAADDQEEDFSEPRGMAETNDDPNNSNSAITGAYYESAEGNALLARIKSLALLK